MPWSSWSVKNQRKFRLRCADALSGMSTRLVCGRFSVEPCPSAPRLLRRPPPSRDLASYSLDGVVGIFALPFALH